MPTATSIAIATHAEGPERSDHAELIKYGLRLIDGPLSPMTVAVTAVPSPRAPEDPPMFRSCRHSGSEMGEKPILH